MKQTERTITIIEYESDDGKVKSEDKKVVEKYEAQKDPIEAITYITVAKLTGIQDESVYKIESEEEFTLQIETSFEELNKKRSKLNNKNRIFAEVRLIFRGVPVYLST